MGSCIAKVDVDGFSMADMQDAIRLGGKPGVREVTILFKNRKRFDETSFSLFLQFS